MNRSLRCDFAGWTLDELDVHLGNPCGKPATHRYRATNDPDAPAGYRCAADVVYLDLSVVTVEPIGGES